MSELVTIVVERADFDATIARLIDLGADATKPMKVVARLMEQNVRDTFRTESDPWGRPWDPHADSAWPPHAPATVRARRSAGNTRTSLLIDTGAMYGSIRNDSGADFASVSMDGPAEVHQYGTTTAGRNNSVTIPARPMFPIDQDPPDAWWDSVGAPLIAAVEKAMSA
jgi:phage virion morphogenesis protein